jgi:hypothetical protein
MTKPMELTEIEYYLINLSKYLESVKDKKDKNLNPLYRLFYDMLWNYKNYFDNLYVGNTELIYGTPYKIIELNIIDENISLEDSDILLYICRGFITCKTESNKIRKLSIFEFLDGINLPF